MEIKVFYGDYEVNEPRMGWGYRLTTCCQSWGLDFKSPGSVIVLIIGTKQRNSSTAFQIQLTVKAGKYKYALW